MDQQTGARRLNLKDSVSAMKIKRGLEERLTLHERWDAKCQ